MLLDCWKARSWKTIATLAGAIGTLTANAAAFRPHIIGDYVAFSHSGYMSAWPSALGRILRLLSGDRSGHFGFQVIAPISGASWLLFYWRKHRANWNWVERMPMLISVSILSSSYAWVHDQHLLLIPIAAVAARYVRAEGIIPRHAAVAYAAVNAVILAVTFLTDFPFADMMTAFPIAPLAVIFALTRPVGRSESARAEQPAMARP